MTRRRNKAEAKPTWTSLVLDALVAADDFLSMQQINVLTGAKGGQASAALHHMLLHKVVDCVQGSDGKLWWFATPQNDDRLKVLELRVPEEVGSRNRRASKSKTST